MVKKADRPKMGRPPLPPEKRKRPSMGFRPTVELRGRLEKAAAASGLSMTQEVERRLERSFRDEDRLGGPVVFRLATLFGITKQLVEEATEKEFKSDQYTFDQVVESWMAILMKLRPAEHSQIDLLSDPVIEKELYGRHYGKRIGEAVLSQFEKAVEKTRSERTGRWVKRTRSVRTERRKASKR